MCVHVSEKVLKLEQNEKNDDTRGEKRTASLLDMRPCAWPCTFVHACPSW